MSSKSNVHLIYEKNKIWNVDARTSNRLAVLPSGLLNAVLYAVPHILQAGAPFPVVLITRAVGPHIEE